MTTLQDHDPNRSYVWAPEHGTYDVGYYQSLGYDVEILREGAVRPVRMGRGKKGEPIMQLGQVLMSCPKEFRDEMDAAGQRELDEIERKIYDKSFPRNQVREAGISTRGRSGDEVLLFENETTPSVVTPEL